MIEVSLMWRTLEIKYQGMIVILVDNPDTPTLSSKTHPLNFNENKLIIVKCGYNVLKRRKAMTWDIFYWSKVS